MKWRKWHIAAAAASLVAIGVVAGRRTGSAPEAIDGGTTEAEPLARAPEDLLADIFVATPNAAWGKLQRGIGGAVGILPATLPGVLVMLTDLDVQLGNELDGTSPIYGVVSGDVADPATTFAMKLVDPRRARVLLAEGEAARFTAKEGAGLTLLVPKRAGGERAFEIAISQNGYLIVTRRAGDLARHGHYVTRTLPSRPLPPRSAGVIALPRKALASAIKPKLESLWKEAKSFLVAQDARLRAERGRAPDFGDPGAIIAHLDGLFTQQIAITGDLDEVRVSFDVTDDALLLDASLVPPSEPGPARVWIDRMKVGDAASILALPSTAAVALSIRDGESARADQGKALEQAILASFGPRLKEPTKVREIVDAASAARDETLAFAYGLDDPPGLVVRAPLRDGASFDRAIRGAFDLAKTDPFRELLRVRDATSSNEEVAGVGSVSSLVLLREPKLTDGKPTRRDAGAGPEHGQRAAETSGVVWAIDRNTLLLAAGSEPKVTYKSVAKPDRALGGEPSLKRFVETIGNGASTVFVGQPLRFDPKRANLPPAPFALSIGKRGAEGVVHVDIADGLLRELARMQMGF